MYSITKQELKEMNTSVVSLGENKVDSPLKSENIPFIDETMRVLVSPFVHNLDEDTKNIPSFEMAGPHSSIYHDPSWTRAAVITCGGLCPGLNDVIRGLVETLYDSYGVKNVFGIRYGYEGLIPSYGHEPMMLTPQICKEIHTTGGTILGSSRGGQDISVAVDTLQRMNINVLFCCGGDGTLHGARSIHEEAHKRGYNLSVIGVPKTIDNDICFVQRSFGFDTAVSEASRVLHSAYVEATGAYNGIGLVKLMGRDSGFISAHAALAQNVADFVLIPEAPFTLEGDNGLFSALHKRLDKDRCAVIVVAEGAGQNLMQGDKSGLDASGNQIYKDVGMFLKAKIKEWSDNSGVPTSVKYIDPSYEIRSTPANAADSIYCLQLAQAAVHSAMAGRTNCLISLWNGQLVLVPIDLAIHKRKVVDTKSQLWLAVLEATGMQSNWGE